MSDAATLVFGQACEQVVREHALRIADLRAHDLPSSALALRLDIIERWRQERLLCLWIDPEPSDAILPVLFEATRRAFNLGPAVVQRFEAARKLVVFSGASEPPPLLASFFPLRLAADRLVCGDRP